MTASSAFRIASSELTYRFLEELRGLDTLPPLINVEGLVDEILTKAKDKATREGDLCLLLRALSDYWREYDILTPERQITELAGNVGVAVNAADEPEPQKDIQIESRSIQIIRSNSEPAAELFPGDEPSEDSGEGNLERPKPDTDPLGEGANSVTPTGQRSFCPQLPSSQPPESGPGPTLAQKITLHLRNAKVGEEYQHQFSPEDFKNLRLFSDAACGLQWDEKAALLSGCPPTAGEYQLVFHGTRAGQRIELQARLAVIPDPKSLWTSTPSNAADIFWKPDDEASSLIGDLLGVGASKRGRSHARTGGFRDDDFVLLQRDGWYVAAAADGAGSATYSRRGSKIAVDTVATLLPSLLTSQVGPTLETLLVAHRAGDQSAAQRITRSLYGSLAKAAFEAARAIESEAAERAVSATAFYTTLIIAACTRTSLGWFFACFSIGDGGAAVYSENKKTVWPLTRADGGEFAGQTRFLQSSEFSGSYEEIAKRIRFAEVPEFSIFAVMTDGITDPKFPTDASFESSKRWAEFWEGDLKECLNPSAAGDVSEKKLLNWLDFWSPGNHDDRTIVALVLAAGTQYANS